MAIEIESLKSKTPEPVIEEPISPSEVKPGMGRLSSIEDAHQHREQSPNFWEEQSLPKSKPRHAQSVQIEEIDIVEQQISTPTTEDMPKHKTALRKESIEIVEKFDIAQKPIEKEPDRNNKQIKRAISSTKEDIDIVEQIVTPQTPIENDESNKKKLQRGISARKESIEVVDKSKDDCASKKRVSVDDIEKPTSQKGERQGEVVDEEMEALLKRAQRQRSLIEDISEKPEGTNKIKNLKQFYNTHIFTTPYNCFFIVFFKLFLF